MAEWIQKQINRLQARNIDFRFVLNKEAELEQQWENAFTKSISKSQKRKMAFYQSMWNVFSWGKIECLKGQQAIDAFDQQKKGGCYLINAGMQEAIYIPKAGRIKAIDIIHTGSSSCSSDRSDHEQTAFPSSANHLMDLFFVNEDFDWTYVMTHEEDYGPYFHKL